jgi:hypothetical protein
VSDGIQGLHSTLSAITPKLGQIAAHDQAPALRLDQSKAD